MNSCASEGQYEIRYVECRFHVYGSHYDASPDPDVNNGPIIGSVGSEEEAQQIAEWTGEPELCRIRLVATAYEVWMGGNPRLQTTAADERGFEMLDAAESFSEAMALLEYWIAESGESMAEAVPIAWRISQRRALHLVASQ